MMKPCSLATHWIVGLAMTVVIVPGCGRAPEAPPPAPEPTVTATEAEPGVLTTLELPQINPEIGITLTAVPANLVATFNGSDGFEVTDAQRPVLRYNFEADRPGAPSRGPSSIGTFETFVRRFNDGTALDSGSLKTALGDATWASGSYFEEDQTLIDIRVFTPHPSGSGTLVVWTVSPAEAATVEERLSTIRRLLDGVS